MSKQIFRSHNKVGETMSLKTNSSGTTTFDPTVGKYSGRVSWDLGVGSGFTAGNNISYTYPDSTTKIVTIRTNLLSTLTSLNLQDDNIVGQLDMSGWDNLFDGVLDGLNVADNIELTGITHTYSPYKPYSYSVDNCNLIGTHDLRMFPAFGGNFFIENNPNLHKILFTASTEEIYPNVFLNSNDLYDIDFSGFIGFARQFRINYNINLTGMTFYTGTSTTETQYFLAQCPSYSGIMDLRGLKLLGYFDVRTTPMTAILHGPNNGVWGSYWANQCDITGNHDLSMFPTLGGSISLYLNSNLTGVTHTASTAVITSYSIQQCNLIGNLDLSMFPNLSNFFAAGYNPLLTGITHVTSTQVMGNYIVNNCDLTGNYDVSMFPSGFALFNISHNLNLTSITHTANTTVNTGFYGATNCNLTGPLDLSMLTEMGGIFQVHVNPNLTSIVHTASSETFTVYTAYECDLTGTFDLSMLTGLGQNLRLYSNTNLTDITFPHTTQTFKNSTASVNSWAFPLYDCDLGFVNFLPLSGITMDVDSINGASIGLNNNTMSSGEVDNILMNFSGLSNTYNPQGWTGVTLDISGNNAAPGPVGMSAVSSLTGTPNNWNITIS